MLVPPVLIIGCSSRAGEWPQGREYRVLWSSGSSTMIPIIAPPLLAPVPETPATPTVKALVLGNWAGNFLASLHRLTHPGLGDDERVGDTRAENGHYMFYWSAPWKTK